MSLIFAKQGQVLCSAYLLSPELLILSLTSFICLMKRTKPRCKCFLLCCWHLKTAINMEDVCQACVSSPSVFLRGCTGLLFGRWLLEKGLWNPFPPLCDKMWRLCVFFRRLSSRHPMLLPCGAVSPSTSRAAGEFSTQPWALEATPVSCCCYSSCRQRQKAIRHPNRWCLRLCERKAYS